MRKEAILFLSMLCMFLLAGCAWGEPAQPQAQGLPETTASESGGTSPALENALGRVEISFSFVRQSGVASNQFAVWIEDAEGHFVKTLYATGFTARRGYAVRKEALSVWVNKSKAAETSQNDIAAVSGATPQTDDLTYTWNCIDQSGNPVPAGHYKFFVEGTLFWESSVLHSGTIVIGESPQSQVVATAEYSSADTKNDNMIGAVTAVYIPGDGSR